MKRFQLFEFMDLPWFPNVLRDGTTDLIHYGQNKFRVYTPIYPLLFDALEKQDQTTIVSLCTGAGGPFEPILQEIQKRGKKKHKVILTDLYPNTRAFSMIKKCYPRNVEIIKEGVNASATQKDIKGFRTLFTSFHHFRPNEARSILKDAVIKKEGVGVFEYTERTPGAVLVILISAFMSFFLTPFFKPFRWSRLFFTYIIPLIPPLATFDGIVSCLRSYTTEELRQMTKGLSDHYEWKIGQKKSPFILMRITYLIGQPKKPAS